MEQQDLISKYRKELMGFAAIWILFYNTWIISSPVGSLGYKLVYFLKITGICGVDIFLFLSGMGLMHSMKDKNCIKFYKRRLSRIAMPMIIMAVAYAIVNSWTFVETLKNLLGITFYTKTINTFLWFSIAIMSIYIIFPLYHKILTKCKNKWLFFTVMIMLWYIFSISGILENRGDMYQFTNRLPVFLLGTMYGYIPIKVKSNRLLLNMISLVGLFAGLQLFYVVYYKKIDFIVPKPIFFIPCLLICVSLCILLPNIFNLIRNYIKILSLVGNISFELYCVQSLIVKIISKNIVTSNKILLSIITLIISFISSIVLYYTVEILRKIIHKLYSK